MTTTASRSTGRPRSPTRSIRLSGSSRRAGPGSRTGRRELVYGEEQAASAAAITRAQKSTKPSLIACKTVIGYGAPHKAGTAKAHGEALGADELKAAKENLGISLEPFSVPDDVLQAWREAGRRGATARTEWEARF